MDKLNVDDVIVKIKTFKEYILTKVGNLNVNVSAKCVNF